MDIADLADQTYMLHADRQRRKDRVVIFANSDFGQKPGFSDLAWVKQDCVDMNDLWSPYKVELQHNKTKDEMQRFIEKLSGEVTKESSCLILIFLTYGDHGLVYGADTEPIALQKLLAPLKGDKCLKLAGKPKILILQTNQSTLQTDSDKPTVEFTIPSEADFLYLWSRLPGHKFVENPSNGSLFMRKLLEMLKSHQGETLTTIMRRTIQAVEQHLQSVDPDYLNRSQELPFLTSQLRKRLIIPNLN